MRFLFLFLILSNVARAGEIWMSVGEVRTFPAGQSETIRVGQRGIIRVVDNGKGVAIVGLKPGSTTLAVGARPLTIFVGQKEQKHLRKALRKAILNMMGLKFNDGAATPEISGTLYTFSDWAALAEIASAFEGRYRFIARALPDVATEALLHFQRLAKKNNLPLIRFQKSPYLKIFLPASQPELKQTAERVFAPYGLEVVAQKSDLALQPLIRTQVILAEVSKGHSRQWGIQWPSEAQAQILPTVEPKPLLASLRALEATGHAQVLASPNLLCRSGSEAQFHAGGEFPVRLISRNARDVQWKSHGVLLKVKPKADFHGTISLELETEISLLDHANAVDGVPSLKKNTVKSHFDLPGRRTIALSGLIRQDWGLGSEGLPFLASLPVLGKLFGSESFQRRQSELVIFVTPEIFVPEADEPLKMPAGWVQDEL